MAALRSHGMVRIHVIKKLLDWPAVRLVRHQVEPGQVRQPSERHRLSVSNSSSGRRWKLDHAPAVGDPTHMVEFGTGRRAFAREA